MRWHCGCVLRYDAVLFDWSGTLVHDPWPAKRVRWALDRVGRAAPDDGVTDLLARLDEATREREVVAALRDEDTSAERHRFANMLWFERAGLDAELAEALYGFDAEAENRPLYPDTAETLAALKQQGVAIAVVSDIHLDIRILLDGQGVDHLIDAYVLSFEMGCQKPAPLMFLRALDRLEVGADRALMVGDRCSHDGGAVGVGITTLILPPCPRSSVVRGLDVVPRMVVA